MSTDEFDLFTSERILDAAARGETVEGFESLGELLVAFHEPATGAEAAASLPAAAVVPPANAGTVRRFTRRTGTAAAAAFFAFSGAAAALTGGVALVGPDAEPAADEEPATDEEADDTVLNLGYDEDNQLLVWNTSPTDGTYDCTLENGPLDAVYEVDGEDGVVVDELTDDGAAVEFPARDDEAGAPLPYSSDGDCGLEAAEVSGPNGQVNHGMFMKLFNSLHDGGGRGCLNRHLAQSDFGKGDQQIKVSDVDPEFMSVVDGDTGEEIAFSTFAADCERGNSHKGSEAEATGESETGPGNGSQGKSSERGNRSDDGGRPDSPGKSAEAPGQNK